MGWIPISLYSSEFSEGWVGYHILVQLRVQCRMFGYLYPCIAQSLGNDGLNTYILVQLRVQERMGWIPISLYSSEFSEGYLYPCRTQSYSCIAQGLGKDGLDIPISLQDSELSLYSLGSRKGWVGYISLQGSESRKGLVGYLYPCKCIAQRLCKDGLVTYIHVQLRVK